MHRALSCGQPLLGGARFRSRRGFYIENETISRPAPLNFRARRAPRRPHRRRHDLSLKTESSNDMLKQDLDKKRCSSCRLLKSLSDFYKNRSTRSGYSYECKKCKDSRPRGDYWKTPHRRAAERERYLRRCSTPEGKATLLEKNRKYKQSDKGKFVAWSRHLRKNYGIDPEIYFRILGEQGGGCAICGVKAIGGRKMHVDHIHGTSKVRGVLCSKCNQAIGLLAERPELFDRAKVYLLHQ